MTSQNLPIICHWTEKLSDDEELRGWFGMFDMVVERSNFLSRVEGYGRPYSTKWI